MKTRVHKQEIITLRDIADIIMETIITSILIVAFVLFTIAVYLADKIRG